MSENIHVFHSGCLGCVRQLTEGVDFCVGCQYFNADWNWPDLSMKKETHTEKIKRELMAKHGIRDK